MDREVPRDTPRGHRAATRHNARSMDLHGASNEMTPSPTSISQHGHTGASVSTSGGQTGRHAAALARHYFAADIPGRSEIAAFSKPRRPFP